MNRCLTMTLMVSLGLAAGCGDPAENGQYLTGRDAVTWESERRFRIAGNDEMLGQVNLSEGRLNFYVHQFPPGTTISVGDESATTNAEGYAQVEGDVTRLIGATPPTTSSRVS